MFTETDTSSTLTTIDTPDVERNSATDDTAADSTATDDVARSEPAPRYSQRWQCPDCDNGITLHVCVVHAPICNNKARHSRRHIDMQKQKKGNQQ